MTHLSTLIIGSLTASTQAYAPSAPIQWTNRVVMLEGSVWSFEFSAAPQQLLLKDPLKTMSDDDVPHFTLNSDHTIKLKGTDGCIEAASTQNADGIRLNRCTGKPAQKWNWIPGSHGGSRIQLKGTDKCLDATIGGGFNGAPVMLWECESKGAEAWRFEEVASLPKQGRYMVLSLISLAGVAALSLAALVWQDMGQPSSVEAGGVSLSSPLAVQMIASPRNPSQRNGALVMKAGKGWGGAEVTRDPKPTEIDPNNPKGKQTAIHQGERFAEYLAKRSGDVRMSAVRDKTIRRSGDIFMGAEEAKKRWLESQETPTWCGGQAQRQTTCFGGGEATPQPGPVHASTSPGPGQGNQATSEEEAKKRWLESQETPTWGGGQAQRQTTGFRGGEATPQPEPVHASTGPGPGQGNQATSEEEAKKRWLESQEDYLKRRQSGEHNTSAVEGADPVQFAHAPLSFFACDCLTPKGRRSNVDVGDPHDATRALAKLGTVSVGSWSCSVGGWVSPTPRPTTEVFHVFSGKGSLTDADGEVHCFAKGDTVTLPRGWSGRWDITEAIHKVWFVHSHEPVEGASVKVRVSPLAEFRRFKTEAMAQQVRKDAANGSPATATREIYSVGATSVGYWTCTAGGVAVNCIPTTECFHVLEGLFFLTNADGSATRCTAGDTVILPKGWTGHLDVIETLKKVWVVVSD